VAERHRPPRAHGHPPHVELAELLHRRLDVVLFADGDAAAGEDQIGAFGAVRQRRFGGVQGVGDDAEVDGLAADPGEQGAEQGAVGVVDLPRRQRWPGSTSSSPLAKKATRRRRRTESSALPTEAATPRCWGRNRTPAASTWSPARSCSPR
jgi:hypothetical protein